MKPLIIFINSIETTKILNMKNAPIKIHFGPYPSKVMETEFAIRYSIKDWNPQPLSFFQLRIISEVMPLLVCSFAIARQTITAINLAINDKKFIELDSRTIHWYEGFYIMIKKHDTDRFEEIQESPEVAIFWLRYANHTICKFYLIGHTFTEGE
jgi:hypothetical protein